MNEIPIIFPLLFILLSTIVCVFIFMIFLCIWLYQDSKRHGQNPVLWVLICIFSSPILALILYLALGRKRIMIPCDSCHAPIPKDACYCEHCGAPNTQKDAPPPPKKHSASFKGAVISGVLVVVGMISIFCIMLIMFFSDLPSPGTSAGAEQISSISISSEPFVVNSGWTTINTESHKNGVWNFHMADSSNGYHMDSRFNLTAPDSHILVADIECTGGPLLLELRQNDVLIESYDLSETTDHDAQLEIPLSDYSEGVVKLRIVNEGATDITGSVWVTSNS